MKAYPAAVTNDQHTILTPGDFQLHSVTAFYLKCHMVGMAVVMMSIRVMMVRLPLHIYDLSRHSQSGRILIFELLRNILDHDSKKQNEE